MSTKKTFSNIKVFKKLFRFIRPYQKTFWILALIAILLSGFGVARSYLFKVIINDYIIPKDYFGMLKIIGLMAFLLVTEIGSQISFIYYSNWLGQHIIRDIRLAITTKITGFAMKYFQNTSIGMLVTRVVNDMERVGDVFNSGLFEIISDLLKMAIVIVLMLYTDWQLALLVFITLPVILYLTHWFQKSMKTAFGQVRQQVANLNSFVQERLVGMKSIQLLARENAEFEKFKQINQKHRKAWLDTIWYNSIFFPAVELISSVAIAIIVWYGAVQSVQQRMDFGTMLMFIQLIQLLFKPLRQIADKFNTLQMGMVASQRIFEVLNTHEIHNEKASDIHLKPTKGEIRFENVRFSYKAGEEILRGISFEVQTGETLAIVGQTGAGKSTIINLINRFYEISSGRILIDNQDISQVSLTSLRNCVGVVLQDVFLFSDTILNNITLKNPSITQEQVVRAAKEIGIHDFIQGLPQGYGFNVKERGAMLSVGQRQLIAFLRAYVHNPQILILDEATSSIDSYSEKLIQNATEKITHGRTSIIIAHRLATIQKADKILVLDKGKIVQSGTHNQLLQTSDGYYAKLINAARGRAC